MSTIKTVLSALLPKSFNIANAIESAVAVLQNRGGMGTVTTSDEINPETLKRFIVAGQPALAVGTKFILTGKSVQVNAQINGVDRSYPAFVILTENGKTALLAYSALIQPWMPTEFSATDKRRDMYEQSEIDKLIAFHKAHDRASVVNSPAAGFKLELDLDQRIEKFSGALEVTAAEVIRGTFTSKETGAVEPMATRMYAISKADDAAFKSNVEKALKASASN